MVLSGGDAPFDSQVYGLVPPSSVMLVVEVTSFGSQSAPHSQVLRPGPGRRGWWPGRHEFANGVPDDGTEVEVDCSADPGTVRAV